MYKQYRRRRSEVLLTSHGTLARWMSPCGQRRPSGEAQGEQCSSGDSAGRTRRQLAVHPGLRVPIRTQFPLSLMSRSCQRPGWGPVSTASTVAVLAVPAMNVAGSIRTREPAGNEPLASAYELGTDLSSQYRRLCSKAWRRRARVPIGPAERR